MSKYNARRKEIEIDYDKLADAIVKAKRKLEIEEEKESDRNTELWKKENKIDSEKHKFINDIRLMKYIIFANKKVADNYVGTKTIMQLIVVGILWIFNIVFIISSVLSGYFILKSYNYSIFSFFIAFVAVVFCLIVAGLFRISKYEMEDTVDMNNLISFFSAFVGLVSLIIAIIALFIAL